MRSVPGVPKGQVPYGVEIERKVGHQFGARDLFCQNGQSSIPLLEGPANLP